MVSNATTMIAPPCPAPPLTMAGLEALLREYCPPPAIAPIEQGRAGVTLHRVENNTLRSARPNHLQKNVTENHGWFTYTPKVKCRQCGKEFEPTYGVHHVYCSNACKQKAYRQRKKAGK